MKNNPDALRRFLRERQAQHLYRTPVSSESPQGSQMQIEGKDYLVFCSNDYLGLANHPNLIHSFKKATDTYGVGSGAAHLVNGHFCEHQALEEELADFTGRERALLFSTGYMANLGVVNALMESGDMIYADRLNHASLIDAGLLSKARMKRYAHNDMHSLKKKYTNNNAQNSMIVTDGVFSMDGDCAPVTSLAKIAQDEKAWLMVDDAHGFGTLGGTGAGLLEQEDLTQQDVPVLMATLGKGLGTAGAFVAGSHELIEFLIQTARTYIFTTAMPPAIAAATRASLKLVKTENWRREKLTANIQFFKHAAQQLGLPLMPSDTAIQPLLIGSAQQALSYSNTLKQSGILVTAIRPPTVPKNTARLRIALSAAHEEAQIIFLLEHLETLFRNNTML